MEEIMTELVNIMIITMAGALYLSAGFAYSVLGSHYAKGLKRVFVGLVWPFYAVSSMRRKAVLKARAKEMRDYYKSMIISQ